MVDSSGPMFLHGMEVMSLMANPFVAEAFSSWIPCVKSRLVMIPGDLLLGFSPVEPLFRFFEWGPTELQVPKSFAFSLMAELFSLFQPNLFPRNRLSALNSLKVSTFNQLEDFTTYQLSTPIPAAESDSSADEKAKSPP